MRKVRTISVSLERDYLEILNRLARAEGSKSDAVRRLLKDHQEREWEQAYREYYSDPENVRRDRELTEELLSIASWPEEWDEKPGKRRRKRRTPR